MKMKILPIVAAAAILVFGFFSPAARADSYIINLFLNPTTKVLSFDNKASFPVSLDRTSTPDYTALENENKEGQYILKLYKSDDTEIISTAFDAQYGPFTFEFPYFSIATTAKIFDASSEKELLSTDISSLSTCNTNQICEYEKGENYNTCLSDCDVQPVTYSPETLKILEENKGTIKDSTTGTLLLENLSPATTSTPVTPATRQSTSIMTYVYLSLSIVVCIVLAWFGYKKYIKDRE